MRRTLLACAIVALTASPLLAEEAPQTWELREGRWQQATVAATRPVSDETLDAIEKMLVNGQAKPARNLALAWLKGHKEKETPLRDRAVFLLAESYYQTGDRILSFYYFDEVMDEYPESDLFYTALQRQYDIADEFLAGYKRRFLGMKILPAEDEAVDMLYRIQSRSPGSPLAEKALLRTADYYFATSQFDLAADTYAAYAKNYPRSPVDGRVRLRQAYSTLAQFRGTMFDPTPLIDSRALMGDLTAGYPDLAASENIPAVVDRIDLTFAKKLYNTGDFYIRTHEPAGAVYTWRYLIKAYPKSVEAAKARTQLARMDPKYLKGVEPESANGYSPATTATEGLR